MIHKVHITQRYRVQASITIEVEADTLEEAIEMVEGDFDLPDLDQFEKSWELIDEEVTPG